MPAGCLGYDRHGTYDRRTAAVNMTLKLKLLSKVYLSIIPEGQLWLWLTSYYFTFGI